MTRIRLTPGLILTLLALVLLNPLLSRAQEAPELMINSERYIVIDGKTGAVYAQRGANDRVAIASLTKVFTAVQAMNMAPLDTPIITKQSDVAHPEATAMGFGPNETYTLEDMIYGMLLPSGNDAATAVARTLGYRDGDTDEEAIQHFMDLVNQRVKDMGLQNTFLITPDGWGVPGHYSTAADVAAFMQYAMEYPFLAQVMRTPSYTTSNGLLTVTNTNKMLNSYAPLVAGKTGYDWDSGWCLVNVAEQNGAQMIAVTLDGIAPDDWYDDNRVLLDYGFETRQQLASSGESFSGDTVAWRYPDAAELAAIGETSVSVTGSSLTGETTHVETSRPAQPVATDLPERYDAAGPLLAGISAVALIGASGALHWRKTGGGFRIPHPQRSTT